MPVEVYLPPSMQSLAGGLRRISSGGSTVDECLNQIIALYPALKEAIFESNHTLCKKLSFYVNSQNAHPDILKKGLMNGDKLYIMDILAGG